MKTNDIKKGMRVKLSFSASMGQTPRWEAVIIDNMRGNIRLADVYGFEHEMGSIYSHDIEYYKPTPESDWVKVEHTPAQLKVKQEVNTMW